MRHKKQGRKLNRNASHRKAMFANMVSAIVRYEMIQTTDAKAKELRRFADKMITLGKKDTLHARRKAFSILRDRDLVAKVFDDLAKRDEIASREGGYTRIVKLRNRAQDNAPISRISWVGATLENTEKYRYPKDVLDAKFEAEDTAE